MVAVGDVLDWGLGSPESQVLAAAQGDTTLKCRVSGGLAGVLDLRAGIAHPPGPSVRTLFFPLRDRDCGRRRVLMLTGGWRVTDGGWRVTASVLMCQYDRGRAHLYVPYCTVGCILYHGIRGGDAFDQSGRWSIVHNIRQQPLRFHNPIHPQHQRLRGVGAAVCRFRPHHTRLPQAARAGLSRVGGSGASGLPCVVRREQHGFVGLRAQMSKARPCVCAGQTFILPLPSAKRFARPLPPRIAMTRTQGRVSRGWRLPDHWMRHHTVLDGSSGATQWYGVTVLV